MEKNTQILVSDESAISQRRVRGESTTSLRWICGEYAMSPRRRCYERTTQTWQSADVFALWQCTKRCEKGTFGQSIFSRHSTEKRFIGFTSQTPFFKRFVFKIHSVHCSAEGARDDGHNSPNIPIFILNVCTCNFSHLHNTLNFL